MTLGQCSRIQSARAACRFVASASAAMRAVSSSSVSLLRSSMSRATSGGAVSKRASSSSMRARAAARSSGSRCCRSRCGWCWASQLRVSSALSTRRRHSSAAVGVGGLWSVAVDVVGEVVGVSVGGEFGDVFVVHGSADWVGGAVADPPAQPVGWCGSEGVELLAPALVDGGFDEVVVAGFDAVFVEGAGPFVEFAGEDLVVFGEVCLGFGGEVGGVGVVDGAQVLPGHDFAVGAAAVAGGESDVGVAAGVEEVFDGADVVAVERVDPAADVHDRSVADGPIESFEGSGRIGVTLLAELV